LTLEVKANASEFSSNLRSLWRKMRQRRRPRPMKSLASILIPSPNAGSGKSLPGRCCHPKGRQFLGPIRGVWGKHPHPDPTWQQNSRAERELDIDKFHYSDGDDLLALLARSKDRDAAKKVKSSMPQDRTV